MSFRNWIIKRKEEWKENDKKLLKQVVELDRALGSTPNRENSLRRTVFWLTVIAMGLLLYWLVSTR
jgi:hypothetical protein